MFRLKYQTVEFGDFDIHLRTLRDTNQLPDNFETRHGGSVSSSNRPLFGVLWQSEELLSDLMFEHDIEGLRILEVGCGIALASLVLKCRGANITATDHNPDTLTFLNLNTQLNNLETIDYECTSWSDIDNQLGRFDLIIGSDLLYDHHNLEPLVRFLETHAKPCSNIIMVDPRRGLTGKFMRRMEALGFQSISEKILHSSERRTDAELLVMRFARMD